MFYLATCQDCAPVLPQPFTDAAERAKWAEAHIAATGHRVGYSEGTGYEADMKAGRIPGRAAKRDSVPVSVLEAMASAWEDQAEHGDGSTSYAGEPSGPNHRATLAACARMLREAITHGGAG